MEISGHVVNKRLANLFEGRLVESHPAVQDHDWLIANLETEDDRWLYGVMQAAGAISHRAIIRDGKVVDRVGSFQEETGLFCFIVN